MFFKLIFFSISIFDAWRILTERSGPKFLVMLTWPQQNIWLRTMWLIGIFMWTMRKHGHNLWKLVGAAQLYVRRRLLLM